MVVKKKMRIRETSLYRRLFGDEIESHTLTIEIRGTLNECKYIQKLITDEVCKLKE